MAMDPRKRQRKQEKRRAKQKAARKKAARGSRAEQAVRLARASAAPIYQCLITDTDQIDGMGYAVLSRQLPSGNMAFGFFMVDRYCLGVKDAHSGIAWFDDYQKSLEKIADGMPLIKVSPAACRKFVEGAVQYAAQFGITPHRDYQVAKLIFGDIQTDQCQEDFEYGKNGKPFFFAGPYDTPARCEAITAALKLHCGAGNFDYVIPLRASDLDDFEFDFEEDEEAYTVDDYDHDDDEVDADDGNYLSRLYLPRENAG